MGFQVPSGGVKYGTVVSSATPSINTDKVTHFAITNLNVDITNMSTNMSGTPSIGQKLWIEITGTVLQNITWGILFESGTTTLPLLTILNGRLDVGFIWNNTSGKWRCVAAS